VFYSVAFRRREGGIPGSSLPPSPTDIPFLKGLPVRDIRATKSYPVAFRRREGDIPGSPMSPSPTFSMPRGPPV